MNEVERHETDHECNACGGTVVNDYGNVRCGDITCIVRDHDNDLSWDSDPAEIREHRKDERTYGVAS